MKKSLVFLAILLPTLTIAHTGHGVAENNGLVHLLLSHGFLVGLMIAVVGVGLFFMRKARK